MAYEAEEKVRKADKARVTKLLKGDEKRVRTYGGHNADYWLKYAESKFASARDYRSYYYDKQWMINWVYYLGLTNLKYNVKTGQLDWDEKDPLKYNINEIYAICRAVRGAVTRYQPQWDIDSLPYGQLEQEEANQLGSFMTSLWQKLGMKKKTKEWVLNGMICGIGLVQYGFDDDLDNGEGEVWVDVLDSFDVYIDPNCSGDLQNAKYIVKVVKKSTEDIESDKSYMNNRDISSDNKVSPSTYKEMLESKINPQYNSSPNMGTSLLHEMWCKVKGKDGSEKIHVITVLPESKRLIRFEETDYTEFPFVEYLPDINPNRVYGEGWVKNLVPLQRMLNYLERKTAEFHALFASGKYVTTPNSQVKTVTSENGQIITKAAGSLFEQLDMKPMTSSVFTQINNIRSYMQDIGASNEAFMGKAPSGITSGIALETLVANNMVNLADLTDNLEIALGKLGTALLKLGYANYNVTKEFKVRGSQGVDEVVKVIGQDDPMGLSEMENVIKLPENPMVKVVINSGVAFTKQGKQETLLQLRNGQDIDRRTLLEEMGGFDVDKVEARLAEERAGMPISEMGMQMDESGQPIMGNQPGQPQQSAGGLEPQFGGMSPEQLAQYIQEKGLSLDIAFQEDPALLQALLEGKIPFDIINNTIVPIQLNGQGVL